MQLIEEDFSVLPAVAAVDNGGDSDDDDGDGDGDGGDNGDGDGWPVQV